MEDNNVGTNLIAAGCGLTVLVWIGLPLLFIMVVFILAMLGVGD